MICFVNESVFVWNEKKVAELKSKIAAEKSKEKDTIKLVHKGKQLNDESKTLAEIGIKENDFIILMVFLKVRHI